VVVRRCIDQLGGDPQPVPGSAHAAFQDVAHVQLARDRADVLGRPLERHRRRPRDDAKRAYPRETGRDFVGETIRKVLVFWIRAQVRERQHGDRFDSPERWIASTAAGGSRHRRASSTGPFPRVNLGFERIDAAEYAMEVAVHRKALCAFPAAHGAHAAPEVRGNLLPGIETVLSGVWHAAQF
jgi:hypothetical protein